MERRDREQAAGVCSDNAIESTRLEGHVGIKEHQRVGGRRRGSCRARPCLSRPSFWQRWRFDDDRPTSRGNVRSAIGARIVDDNQLITGTQLRSQRVEQRWQRGRFVPSRHHDRTRVMRICTLGTSDSPQQPAATCERRRRPDGLQSRHAPSLPGCRCDKRPSRRPPRSTEVAPGILRMQLPLQMPGLGHVNCYALEDERGFTIVDPGMPGPKPWKLLLDRFQRAGFAAEERAHGRRHPLARRPFRRVRACRVRSREPRWSRRRRSARGGTRPTSAKTSWRGRRRQPDPRGSVAPADAVGREAPAPTSASAHQVPLVAAADAAMVRNAEPERSAGRCRGRSRSAAGVGVGAHARAHARSSLPLRSRRGRAPLGRSRAAHDHAAHLRRSTPAPTRSPMFFASLDKVERVSMASPILPAHGHPFDDLPGRVKDIHRHHEERLGKLRDATAELGRSAPSRQLSQHLFRQRSWGPMADSETYAHLEHLRLAGKASRVKKTVACCIRSNRARMAAFLGTRSDFQIMS